MRATASRPTKDGAMFVTRPESAAEFDQNEAEGRKPEHLLRRISSDPGCDAGDARKPRHGVDRSVGMREVDVHPSPQSHARPDTGGAR